MSFNREALHQTYKLYDLRQETDTYKDYSASRISDEYSYTARVFNKVDFKDPKFQGLRQMRLYNIIPISDIYINDLALTTQDFSQYSLQSSYRYMNRRELLRVFLLLSVTLQELCYRRLSYFNLNANSIILFDNHVCLQQYDFDFTHTITKELLYEVFQKLAQKILKSVLPADNFFQATAYLLQEYGVVKGTDQMPYADLLTEVFQFEDVIDVPHTMHWIYKFRTPKILQLRQRRLNTVLKSVKLNDNPTYQITCQERELEIMESVDKDEQFVTCYAYFKIGDQLFNFYEQYALTLEEAIQTNEIYFRNAAEISIEIADLILNLHTKYQIIHRDLVASNFHLTSANIDKTHTLLSGFGKSRHLDFNSERTLLMNQSSSIVAPEIFAGSVNYDFKSDIWQVGLIFYQLGCGVLFDHTQIKTIEDYRVLFSSQTISENLSNVAQIEKEYIQIVIDCLSYDESLRPSAEELKKRIQSVLENYIQEDLLLETHKSYVHLNATDIIGSVSQKFTPWYEIKINSDNQLQ